MIKPIIMYYPSNENFRKMKYNIPWIDCVPNHNSQSAGKGQIYGNIYLLRSIKKHNRRRVEQGVSGIFGACGCFSPCREGKDYLLREAGHMRCADQRKKNALWRWRGIRLANHFYSIME